MKAWHVISVVPTVAFLFSLASQYLADTHGVPEGARLATNFLAGLLMSDWVFRNHFFRRET